MPNPYMSKAEGIATLHRYIKPGDTLYTILRHVSTSGMSRRISVIAMIDGAPIQIDHLVAAATGYSRPHDRDGGISAEGLRVSGAGMDMGFHLVYSLGATLWPKGTPKPHGMRNGEPDSDGGYALKQRWL